MATASAVSQMASSFEANDGDKPDYVTIFHTLDNIQILLVFNILVQTDKLTRFQFFVTARTWR